MTSYAPFRLVRSAGIAATVLILALGAHLSGGGRLPALPILAALIAFTCAGSMAATHFRLRLPAMLVVLLGSQFLLHAALSALSAVTNLRSVASGHVMSMPGMDMTYFPGSTAAVAPSASMVDNPWMTAAHIAAALLSAVVLAKGEAALWALADWLRPFLGLPATAILPRSARGALHASAPQLREPRRNLRANRHRGPPAARRSAS